MKANFKVVRKLKNLEKRVQAVKNMYDATFLTGKISKDMKKEVDMRFRKETDPEGRPWKGLKSGSLFRRQGLSNDENTARKMKKKGFKNNQIERLFGLEKGTVGKLQRSGDRRQKRRPKILQDTGRLRNSVRARHTRTEAIVGTNVKYAAVHNFGYPKRNIPQRRFMGLNRGQRIKYKDWIIKWQKGQLR